MKGIINTRKFKRNIGRFCALALFCYSMLLVNVSSVSSAVLKADNKSIVPSDSALLARQIKQQSAKLNFPASVARFYRENGSKRIWVYPDTVKSPIWQAMLLLDCVLQFGLNRQDFHPDRLDYALLKPLSSSAGPADESGRTVFDIYLTDALLTLINHLHYGKFNPLVTRDLIEAGEVKGFRAEALLATGIKAKDFMETVVSAQPKLKAYTDLQNYLHLVKGQYIDDCYEFPEGDARRMALNMERMRWMSSTEPYFIQVNIPAYSLKVINGDTEKAFKVVVGRAESPTPELESQISYLTTAPEWKIPQKIFFRELLPRAIKNPQYLQDNHYNIYDQKGKYVPVTRDKLQQISKAGSGYTMRQSSGCDNALGKIVFRFPNRFDIYLHDTPEQKLFSKGERAYSHGCIRVEKATLLAEILLINDGSAAKIPAFRSAVSLMRKTNFKLRNPVPIKITYLTCEIIDGMLVSYPDVYNRDPVLLDMMFPKQSLLVEGG